MTSTLAEKAVTGRRIEYRVHRSVNDDRADVYAPGIITRTDTSAIGTPLVGVRLDGQRSNITMPADFDGLRYLDQVVAVPALPMGRFNPSVEKIGSAAYQGVTVCNFDDDDLAALTDDKGKAVAAVAAHLREAWGIEDDEVIREHTDDLVAKWVYFAWEPEDAECAWRMHWAAEGDDQAIRVHYMPAL